MKFRKLLFITFFSLSFCQYFIVPQRPIFNLLKWEEINSNQILIQKVGPLINTQYKFSEIASFYYSDSISATIINSELYPEVSFDSKDGSRIRLYGTAGIALNDKLTIQNEFEFDNRGEYDPHFQGSERQSVPGWVGYLQHSSVNYFYSSGHLSLGRGNPYLFNMNESLLLNPNFAPAEFIWWQHEIQWFHFDWGILLLNKIETLNRFLTYHRYSMNKKNLRIGFTEAVIGTYENWGASETGYIMPAAILLETEENRGINANLMWLLDGMIKWNNWTFYGEFLIDDYALDGLSPPQIAGSIGLGRKFDKTLLNMEYTRINRWTGNYCDPYKIWAEKDVLIGHSMGSNAHQFLLNSYFPFNNRMAVELSIKWLEIGSGESIERLKEWPDDVECDNNFGNNEPAPSEINTTFGGEVNLHYLFQPNLMVQVKFSGDKKRKPSADLIVSYKLLD